MCVVCGNFTTYIQTLVFLAQFCTDVACVVHSMYTIVVMLSQQLNGKPLL